MGLDSGAVANMYSIFGQLNLYEMGNRTLHPDDPGRNAQLLPYALKMTIASIIGVSLGRDLSGTGAEFHKMLHM